MTHGLQERVTIMVRIYLIAISDLSITLFKQAFIYKYLCRQVEERSHMWLRDFNIFNNNEHSVQLLKVKCVAFRGIYLHKKNINIDNYVFMLLLP